MATQETISANRAPNDYSSGVIAFADLLRDIGAVSNDTCLECGDGEDGRDYRRMATLVQDNIENTLHQAAPAHREGWMQALAYLLCLNADGCGADADTLRRLVQIERPFI